MPSTQWLIGAGKRQVGQGPSAHQPQPMRSLFWFLDIVVRGQWRRIRVSRSHDSESMAGDLNV